MKTASKLFIVEDDPLIVSVLRDHLSQAYHVYTVQNFRAISQEIAEVRPDVILMDITLPYFNGFYWTTEIRKTMTVPIIFISSSDDEMNAIMAMNMGGDDYITKPFSLELLSAKLSAILRRTQVFVQQGWTFETYTLTPEGELSMDGHVVTLTPTETKILSTLMSHSGSVVSKEVLLDKLWQGDEFIDQNTLSVHVTRLRKKIAEIGFDHIHTVRGVGYLLQ